MVSNACSSSVEDSIKGSSNYTMNLFIKLGEAFRKTSLARREEMRNHAIASLHKSFTLAEELGVLASQLYQLFQRGYICNVRRLTRKDGGIAASPGFRTFLAGSFEKNGYMYEGGFGSLGRDKIANK
ncbi:hypothetical protein OIU77_006049 [Salix suchowensis]|uniref:Uncharacterized protein n=1 Tax=Salix suchowensis TaxID=1278906 RepID=A0ABQ9ASZ0_9ROSI|nr:hypothetical protein OIU77_006049 [Salix suchowensis]